MARCKLSYAITALALAAVASPAMADIFMMKDERGVVHFTNIPPSDKRFKMVRKESSTPALTAAAGLPQISMPREESIRRYSPLVERASRDHGVDVALVHAVISAESGYDRYAVSRTGAMGLMQLMPDTARRYGVQNIMDPAENIHGGVRYLADLMQMFKGRMDLAIAAYNAGENAVIRAGHKVPNYAETRHYVPKVLGFYKNFQSRS